jgi:hypothetical protein
MRPKHLTSPTPIDLAPGCSRCSVRPLRSPTPWSTPTSASSSTDYADLYKFTRTLTRNHGDVIRAFRQTVFNIATHNRDEHVKNFPDMLNSESEWSLTPGLQLGLLQRSP